MKTNPARVWLLAIPAILLACMSVPAGAMADSTPGSGSTQDPSYTFGEGVSYTLTSKVFAGAVVLCESGVTCNPSTPTSQWSDVLVFYNTNPYAADYNFDANHAEVFSDSISSGSGSLASLLVNYQGLYSVFLSENPTGPTLWQPDSNDSYTVNSSEAAAVPEPGSLLLLGSGLFGVALKLRRKLAA